MPVTLYDSKGVELGDSRNRVIRDFKRIISKSRKAAPEQHIHLLWYCMDAGQTRVQDYDVEIIRALADEVPVVLVFTQTIDEDRADALGADGSRGRSADRRRRAGSDSGAGTADRRADAPAVRT